MKNLERTREFKVSQGLDYYKPTMSQVQYENYPDAEATFALKNRNPEKPLSEYVTVEALQERLDNFTGGWTSQEVDFLLTQERVEGGCLFTQEFADYLVDSDLPPVNITLNEEGDLDVQTTGPWPLATFWETIVMSEANELYFENYAAQNNVDLEQLYQTGDDRLTAKIEILNANPGIKFADFGTRRRFSWRWHQHVVGRLAKECPDNLIGSSNVALAQEFDLMPIGTYAHEMPMGYAALASMKGDQLDGHKTMLDDWQEFFGDNLSTALTDTFTSEFFFAEFTPEQAESWRALRHDSGDPAVFAGNVIDFYISHGIDPKTKTIVFSDGLNIDKIEELYNVFEDRINMTFGWGTTLTNDLGLPTNNIVMKLIKINGIYTCKLSDDYGKHTGPPSVIESYAKGVGIRTQAARLAIASSPETLRPLTTV